MFGFLKGYKTYIVATASAACIILNACGIPIPPWVYPLAGALGLGTLRAGIKKAE